MRSRAPDRGRPGPARSVGTRSIPGFHHFGGVRTRIGIRWVASSRGTAPGHVPDEVPIARVVGVVTATLPRQNDEEVVRALTSRTACARSTRAGRRPARGWQSDRRTGAVPRGGYARRVAEFTPGRRFCAVDGGLRQVSGRSTRDNFSPGSMDCTIGWPTCARALVHAASGTISGSTAAHQAQPQAGHNGVPEPQKFHRSRSLRGRTWRIAAVWIYIHGCHDGRPSPAAADSDGPKPMRQRRKGSGRPLAAPYWPVVKESSVGTACTGTDVKSPVPLSTST